VFEKKIEMISIKLAESQLHQLRGLAEADGVSMAELVRELIDREIEKRRAQYQALASVFAHPAKTARNDRE
jgi:predicted DNA-binding ribbon-helix-helix protein